jgi:hypothetical protein
MAFNFTIMMGGKVMLFYFSMAAEPEHQASPTLRKI